MESEMNKGLSNTKINWMSLGIVNFLGVVLLVRNHFTQEVKLNTENIVQIVCGLISLSIFLSLEKSK